MALRRSIKGNNVCQRARQTLHEILQKLKNFTYYIGRERQRRRERKRGGGHWETETKGKVKVERVAGRK